MRKAYIRPVITVKKIKLNYFFSKTWWLDQFNIIGQVYAQSNYGDSYGDNQGGYDAYQPPSYGAT